MHRASQMVIEPHAPEAGLASCGGTSKHFVNVNAERIEQQVDLHPPSMSEPTSGVLLSRRSGIHDWIEHSCRYLAMARGG